jgi:hypothetical protein
MKQDRIPIEFPKRGVMTTLAAKDQPPGTTSDAENCRTEDPKSGKMRGGQRPGSVRFFDDPVKELGTRVDHLTSVKYAAPTHTYTGLTEVPNGSTLPDELTIEKQLVSPSGVGAFAVATDRTGNVVVLDGESSIVILNADLEVLETIPIPTGSADQVVRRVLVEEITDAIYVASSSSAEKEGLVFKFSKSDVTGKYVLDKRLEVEGGVTDVSEIGGLIYLALNYDEGYSFAAVEVWDFSLVGDPELVAGRNAPHPINRIDALPDGSLAVSCGPNPNRGRSPEGNFTTISHGWTPYDLLRAESRVYCHLGAVFAEGLADGDRASELADSRFSESWVPYGLDITDTPDRGVRQRRVNDNGDRRGLPAFRSMGLGLNPGIYFDGGRTTRGSSFGGDALVSRPNRNGTPKTLVEDVLRGQRAIIPGFQGARWCLGTMVFPDPRDDHPSVVWAHKSGRLKIALLVNASPVAEEARCEAVSGSVWLDVWGATGGAGPNAVSAALPNAFLNDVNGLLVTIVLNGDRTLSWYVNGDPTPVDTITVPDEEAWSGRGAVTTFGSPRAVRRYSEHLDVYDTRQDNELDGGGGDQKHIRGLWGTLFEVAGFLGDHSPGPHDQDVGTPERQSLEGYLAHAAGCAHILDGAHPWTGAGNFEVGSQEFTDPSPNSRTLSSPDPLIVKFGTNGLGVRWSFDGPGVGYGVASDGSTGIFTTGPRLAGVDEGVKQPITRKLVDLGTSLGQNVVATGYIELGALPIDGDQVILNDGTNPAITFEFQTIPGTITETPTLREVDIAAPLSSTRDNLVTEINNPAITLELSALAGTALFGGELLNLRHDFSGESGNEPIQVSGSGVFTTSGMSGGIDVGAWDVEGDETEEPTFETPQLGVDPEGNLYVPELSTVSRYDGEGDARGGTTRDWRFTFTGLDLHAVGFPPFFESTSAGPETMYAVTGQIAGDFAMHRVRLVAVVRTGATNPRALAIAGISGGTFQIIGPGVAPRAPATTMALDAGSPYFRSVGAFGKIFGTDGTTAFVYDPIEDKLEEYTAHEGGAIPKRLMDIVAWNGRLVMLSFEDRGNYYATAIDAPFNRDEFPTPSTARQAFSGRGTVSIGIFPDQANVLIPWSREILIAGCDSSFYMIVGDPLRHILHQGSERGAIQLITDRVGAAYGKSWARDENGRLFVYGTTNGVYELVPTAGGTLEMTDFWIDPELRDIDLSTYRVDLEWDTRRKCLQVFFIPLSPEAEPMTRWCYERRVSEFFGAGGWWPEKVSNVLAQPSAVHTVDSDDPAEALMLLGTENGRVLVLDDEAPNDDGYRIESRVTLWPIMPPREWSEIRFGRFQSILAEDQQGAHVSLLVSANPDDATFGRVRWKRRVPAGRSPFLAPKAVGAVAGVRIENAAIGERWAFEGASIEAIPLGIQLPRRT